MLAGPAVFGGADRPCEIVYKNRNNSISCQADIQSNEALGGFTLNEMSVIRGEQSAPRLNLSVAGNFDIHTQFTAPWGSDVVAQKWDSRSTTLTFLKMNPCTIEADLEPYAHDLSGIMFSDTPCKGAMQELRFGSP